MKQTWMPLIGCLIASLLFVGTRSETEPVQAEPAAVRLPGARAVIDAAGYPDLQAALDALPPEGGMVQLPPGTFEIRKPLTLRTGDVLLAGAGTSTHIHNLNEEGASALIIKPAPTPEGKAGEPIWRVQLTNLRITGNPKSGDGIHAERVNEIFIHGVTVSENGADGIVLDHCYEDPRVCNSLITYNKQVGLNLPGCHDIVVSGNQFEENNVALRCTDAFNLCMTGNCVDDHLAEGVIIENTYGSVLSGNMIEECNRTAIVLDRDCYGITLSANVIAHNGGGIDLRDAHGCAVSANTFTIMKTHALRIGPGSDRITVTGNNFSNSFVGEGVKRGTEDLAAAGMTLEGTSHVTVSGNLFSSVAPKAVALEGDASKRILFSNNVLTDVDSDHPNLKESFIEQNLIDVPQ